MHTSSINSESVQLPLMLQHESAHCIQLNATAIAEHSSDTDTATTSAEPGANTTRRENLLIWSPWWTMEILAMTTSIVCMIILIWILARFQDQLSATWFFWISLNAVVAIAATVIKATLLAVVSACLSQEKWWHFGNRSRRLQDLDAIDHASRGPVGSLMLLLGSSWGFASFGAIITILCLTTDTFFQQVVSFESEITYTLQEGSATFGYALNFGIDRSVKELAGSIDAEEDGDTIKRSELSFPTAMQGAIYRGLYQTSWPPIFNCSSNCTWEQDYFTLGFSSTCADVTEESMAEMQCTNTGTPTSETFCEITTPGGVQISAAMGQTEADLRHHDLLYVQASEFKYNKKAWNDTWHRRPNPDPIADMSNLFSVAVWAWADMVSDGPEYVPLADQFLSVMECTMGLVIYKYSNVSSISNDFNIAAIDKIPLGNYSDVTFDDLDGAIMRWNDTGPGHPDFRVSMADVSFIAGFFKSASFSGGKSFYDGNNDYAGDFIVFNHGNVSGIMDNVACSMTDQMRNGNAMQLAQGLTSRSDVYIRVRWLWLILPLTVQVLGGIVLIMAVVGRRQTKHVPLWKASTLAVLYHSVGKDGVLKSDIKEPQELEILGRTVRVIID